MHKKRREQHFQDVPQKVIQYNNSDLFTDHFAKQFTQKTNPQKCREIMSFEIPFMVNPIGLMETWEKLSCILCMK